MSYADRLSRVVSWLRLDMFVLALAATVMLATFLPCQGTSASIFGTLGFFAI